MLLVEATYEALARLLDDCESQGRARLPTERELATRLSTSRTTVRKALDRFEHAGRITRVRGRAGGAYLAGLEPVPPATSNAVSLCSANRLLRNLNTVQGVPEMLRQQGFRYGTRVLDAQRATADGPVAAALEVDDGTPVVQVLRLRFADGRPLSLEQMYLSQRCVGILRTQLASVYRDLRETVGVPVCWVDETIELAMIAASEAPLLEQEVGAPVLKLERIGYDRDDVPIEYSVDLFRADRTQLQVRSGSAPSTCAAV